MNTLKEGSDLQTSINSRIIKADSVIRCPGESCRVSSIPFIWAGHIARPPSLGHSLDINSSPITQPHPSFLYTTASAGSKHKGDRQCHKVSRRESPRFEYMSRVWRPNYTLSLPWPLPDTSSSAISQPRPT